MVFPHPASGGAAFKENTFKIIRLVRHGCTNRPFFHIVVMENFMATYDPVIEQVGTYDPLPNKYNEKLVGFNYERIQYWLGKEAKLSESVAELLGLAGFLPVHPKSQMNAWRNRKTLLETVKELNITAKTAEQVEPA